ncbi:GHKL domain-containing protein [Chitinophaga skermanii]|uniref:GHKL domain-containing protein n=1 Tax=Chitinophaga skermanii TaxID=331697 RepID=A0A327QXI9_9BACT|nr:sensor histidine kinase [Chitinophaga skermanii]RAJ08508.1 GHKL domain-containing protein [Chitinophaga skermanii]
MIKKLLQYYEAWMVTVVAILMSLLAVNNREESTWSAFGTHFIQYLGIVTPMIVLLVVRANTLDSKRAHQLWLAAYILYGGTCYVILQTIYYQNAYLIGTILVSIATGIVNGLYNYFFSEKQTKPWWQINFNTFLLIIMCLFALLMAMMSISSEGNPAYDSQERLLIGPVIDGKKILFGFPGFIGYFVQYFTLYWFGYAFFYINQKLLIPILFKQRGLFVYTAGVFGTIMICYPLMAQIAKWMPLDKRLGGIFAASPFDIENGFIAFIIMLFSLPVIWVMDWLQQRHQITILQKQQAETELNLLKQQINPHFFFNTLNNLYALSLTQAKQTPAKIQQLSELMRYVIYQSQSPTVPITAEITYLEDYLSLQSIRKHHPVDISFEKDIDDDQYQIAPLLLVILLENAIKHGIEPSTQESFVDLVLTVKNNNLTFVCTNSVETNPTSHSRGIGLENLARRLQLLYPGNHSLETGYTNNTFTATIKIFAHAIKSIDHR